MQEAGQGQIITNCISAAFVKFFHKIPFEPAGNVNFIKTFIKRRGLITSARESPEARVVSKSLSMGGWVPFVIYLSIIVIAIIIVNVIIANGGESGQHCNHCIVIIGSISSSVTGFRLREVLEQLPPTTFQNCFSKVDDLATVVSLMALVCNGSVSSRSCF